MRQGCPTIRCKTCPPCRLPKLLYSLPNKWLMQVHHKFFTFPPFRNFQRCSLFSSLQCKCFFSSQSKTSWCVYKPICSESKYGRLFLLELLSILWSFALNIILQKNLQICTVSALPLIPFCPLDSIQTLPHSQNTLSSHILLEWLLFLLLWQISQSCYQLEFFFPLR